MNVLNAGSEAYLVVYATLLTQAAIVTAAGVV